MSPSYAEIEEKLKPLVDKAFKNSKSRITQISTSTKSSTNFLGLIYNVTISVNDEEMHFILKLAPQQNYFRHVLPVREMYMREIYTYDNIISEFIKFQRQKRILNPFQSFAQKYLSSSDNCQEFLLMEDLTEKGFQSVDHHLVLDYPHASLIMKEMGRFHALSFAIRDQKPDVFKIWKDNCDGSFFYKASELLIKCVAKLANAILESYSRGDCEKERKALEKFIETFPDVYRKILLLSTTDKYVVINHGDCQIRNLLFKYENYTESSLPTELCMVDWQLAHVGSPTLDILYFIFVCSERKLRGSFYTQLIQEYYDSLASFLVQLGSDPGALFPFRVLQQRLKKFAAFGLFISIMCNAANMRDTNALPDLLYVVSGEDNLIEMISTVPNREYLKRMRDIISDLLEYGCYF